MAIVNLITNPEADTYNAASAGWMALTEDQKTQYIFNASLYMQTSWDCVDAGVDWTDPSTLPEDLKRACAYYAEASRAGSLYPSVDPPDSYGNLIEATDKLGGLETTRKWADAISSKTKNPLSGIDALMSTACTALSTTTTLDRV